MRGAGDREVVADTPLTGHGPPEYAREFRAGMEKTVAGELAVARVGGLATMADPLDVSSVGLTGVDRLWVTEAGTIRGVIHGPLENKSNAKQIARVHGRLMMFQGKQVKDYIRRFESAVASSAAGLKMLPEGEKLYFKAVVYQKNLLRDLDCELLPDLLQKFGLIKNDRQVWLKHYERFIDKENPRVEFEIGVLGA